MNRAAILLFAIILSSPLPRASADIFRQDGEDGVIHFTDIPTGDGFARILRDTPRPPAGISPPRKRGGGNQTLPVQGVLSSGYGPRIDPFSGKLVHHGGMDIAAPYGAPVKPVDDGTVLFSGFRGGYGNMVIVQHPDGTTTLYAHNSQNLVHDGESVSRDTIIALTGSSGRSTGPHLHFEAWKGGENMTSQYLPTESGTTGRHPLPREAPIRRMLMPDGSIAFTNLP